MSGMPSSLNENTIVEGVIWKRMLIFFLPILFGNFFQQFYSVADAAIVGRALGSDALAAIDSTWSLFRIPTTFFIGVSAGATIQLSQAFGAKDGPRCSRLIHTAAAAALLFGLLLSAAVAIACPWLLRLIQVPEDIFAQSLTYSRVYSAGLFIILLFNIGCAVSRAIGDSKSPFYFLVISSLTNILLDLLFVLVFHWGVAGAAAATVLAQGLSAVLVIRALTRAEEPCRLSLREIRLDLKVFSEIFRTGFPVGLQSMLYPFANMLIQRGLNGFGTASIAAWAINGKLDFVLWLVIDSFAVACSTFVAQNYGAKKYRRARQSAAISLAMACGIVIGLSVLFYFFTETFGRLFLDDDAATIRLAAEMMRFIAPWYVTAVFGEVLASAARSTGKTFASMVITLSASCALRIVWILFIAPLKPSPFATLAAYPVSWVTCSAAFLIYCGIYAKKIDGQPLPSLGSPAD